MRQYPTTSDNCVFVCFPKELVPIVAGLLRLLERRDAWLSEADWQQGYQFAAELQEQMMSGCVTNLQASLDELLVLIAASQGIHDPTTTNLAAVFPRLHAALTSAYNADTGHTLIPSVDDQTDEQNMLLKQIKDVL